MTTTASARFDALVVAETQRMERALVALAIPHYMRQGVMNYVIEGIRPGGFLCALLANDLMGAWRAADGVNQQRIGSWAELLIMHIPTGARGSKKALEWWIKTKGFKGVMTTKQTDDEDK